MLLTQLSYPIKTQFKAPRGFGTKCPYLGYFLSFTVSLCHRRDPTNHSKASTVLDQ